jgi:hypothetical protein
VAKNQELTYPNRTKKKLIHPMRVNRPNVTTETATPQTNAFKCNNTLMRMIRSVDHLSNSEKFWKERVQNPEAFGQAEKELWMKLEPILGELLDELKAKGKTEVSFIPTKEQHLSNIVDNLIQINKNENLLLHLFDSPERFGQFLKVSSEFGFDEPKSTSLYVEISAYLCVLSTELFKLFLLFHLRDIDPQVSHFTRTMEEVAPTAWKKLKPYVDNEFRNSLAHGTWAIENKKIVLFRDATLEPYERLELAKFMIKIKRQNLLYACLNYLIEEKRKANFFT